MQCNASIYTIIICRDDNIVYNVQKSRGKRREWDCGPQLWHKNVQSRPSGSSWNAVHQVGISRIPGMPACPSPRRSRTLTDARVTMSPALLLLLPLLTPLRALAFDKTLGVPPSLLDRYTPSGETWKCVDGSKSIPWTDVNNDYCDCPDGSDEPGMLVLDFWHSTWWDTEGAEE